MTASNQKKATNEQIIEAYKATGSVWAAGKRLGMAGQTIHERLQHLGYPMVSRNWTTAETDELRLLIESGLTLGQSAARLGRPYTGVAGKSSELNIKANQSFPKKLPQGAGYDKASTLRHMKAVLAYSGKVTHYARANSLSIEMLVQAFQKYCPEDWQRYVERTSDLPQKTCPYCERSFIPMTGKQAYCSRRCAALARKDRDYFGGKRRTTVGLEAGICQLCERQGVKGLSAHHVFGKENDPENEGLIALCPGCHNLVSLLAARNFIDVPERWEALVSLAWMRKHGADFAAGDLDGKELWCSVEFELDTFAEEAEAQI